MSITTNTVIGSMADVLREELSFVRKDMEPEADGIFAKIYETSNGVQKGIGRDLKIIKTMPTGVGGALKHLTALGHSISAAAGTGQTTQWPSPVGRVRTFQKLWEETNPGYVQTGITLMMTMGTFRLPFQVLMADQLDASLTEVVDLKIRGTARNLMQAEAAAMYADATYPGALVYINNASATPDPIYEDSASTNDVILDFSSTGLTGRVGRFIAGQTLGLFNDATPDALNATVHGSATDPTRMIIVKKVDYIGKLVYLGLINSAGAAVDLDPAELGTGDYLVLFGTEAGSAQAVGPAGIETYLKASGTLFTSPSVSLAAYPQLKSLVPASIGTVLEGSTLNKYIGGFYDAYGAMCSLDSLIGTTGILTAYLDNVESLYRYQMNGQRLTVKEGWMSFDYAYQGQVFEYLASRWQNSGQLYIIKMGGQNYKRFVPPKVKGTSSKAEFPGDIQFIAPTQGSNSIFLPDRASDALTEFSVAPFVYIREYCPDQVQGIKLVGLEETNP